VELDIIPLLDGDFALLHDQSLEKCTDGSGTVSLTRAGQVQRLHYRLRGRTYDNQVGLLSQALSMLGDYPHLQELQLDLKPEVVPSDKILKGLLQLIAPVRRRIRVSSPADWALRRLRSLDPELSLGFDPFLYLDVKQIRGRGRDTPPLRVGSYGYRDDHPLATRLWGSCAQVPGIDMWYPRAWLVERSLEEGFDWVERLHSRGIKVAVWTLDPGKRGHVELAERLVTAGVDRLVTNDAPRLARALGRGAVL
jgi:glycerophosphoryl diester phosphodiesterase